MEKKCIEKIKSKAGESLAETLVALLIAAFAIVMLTGAISASFGVVVRSRKKIGEYYAKNEVDAGVVKMKGSGASGTMTITDGKGVIDIEDPYAVTYFKNDIFSKKVVVAYKKS